MGKIKSWFEIRRAKKEAKLENQVKQQEKKLVTASRIAEKKNKQFQRNLETINRINRLQVESKNLRKATFAAKHPKAVALGKRLSALEQKTALAGIKLGKATGKSAGYLAKVGFKEAVKYAKKQQKKSIRIRPRRRKVSRSQYAYARKTSRRKQKKEDDYSEWFKV